MVGVADAVVVMVAAVSVRAKVVRKAGVRVVADAVVASALKLPQERMPEPRARHAHLVPKVAESGRTEVTHARNHVESHPARAATVAVAADVGGAENARTAMRAPRQSAAIWQPTRCRRPQRPSSTLNLLRPHRVRMRLKAQKSVKARAVAVAGDVAGVTEIRCVKNKSAVTLAPSPTPRLRRGPMRI